MVNSIPREYFFEQKQKTYLERRTSVLKVAQTDPSREILWVCFQIPHGIELWLLFQKPKKQQKKAVSRSGEHFWREGGGVVIK